MERKARKRLRKTRERFSLRFSLLLVVVVCVCVLFAFRTHAHGLFFHGPATSTSIQEQCLRRQEPLLASVGVAAIAFLFFFFNFFKSQTEMAK